MFMQGAVQQDMRGVVDGVIALTPDAVPPMVILPLAVQFGITETRVCGDVLRRLYAKHRDVTAFALAEAVYGEVHWELVICRPVFL